MLNGRTVVFLSCHGADLEPLARPIRDDLNGRGYHAVIVGDEPLLRGTFDPESKVAAYINASDAFVALCTSDERVPGGTAQNIIDEIGRARTHPKLRDVVCVLKEPGVALPSNINPTWEDLRQDDPATALGVVVRQLDAWDIRPEVPAPPAPAPAGSVADLVDALRDRIQLGEHDKAERRLLEVLANVRKQSHQTIVDELYSRLLHATVDGNDIYVYSSFVEAAARIDPSLVTLDRITELAESTNYQFRICAASLLWDMALTAPGRVPLDLLASLARPTMEDWYVFAPALAAVKQLVLTRRSAIGILGGLARSDDPEDRRTAALALLDLATANPAVVPTDLAASLAHDNDAAVAIFGAELDKAINAVTDEERFQQYRGFGLSNAPSHVDDS